MKTLTRILALLMTCVAADAAATDIYIKQRPTGSTTTFTDRIITGSDNLGEGLGFDGTTGELVAIPFQPLDADLTYLAGFTPTANVKVILNAADYAAIRTALSLVVGTNVQAYDADLDYLSTFTPTANVKSVLNAADYAAIRTLLSLVIGTNVQAYDADLTTYAGITPSANVQSVLGAADYAAIRTLLGLVIGTDVQAFNSHLADLADGLLTGSKVGTGIDAGNVTTGTLPVGRLSFTKAELDTAVSNDNGAYIGTANVFTAAQSIQTGTLAIGNGDAGADNYAGRVDAMFFNRGDLPTTFRNKITNSFSGTESNTTMNFELTNAAGSGFSTILTLVASGNILVGANTNTTGKLQVTATIGPQLGLFYDASNYATDTISSTGARTIDMTGSGAALIVPDFVSITNGTEATTAPAGAIKTDGGIYAAKAIISDSNTASTSTTTGGIIQSGTSAATSVGIGGGNINAGGDIALGGAVNHGTVLGATLGVGATTFAVANNIAIISGDAGGNTIATITGGAGKAMVVHLIFTDALVTITDDATGTADTVNLMGSGVNFVSTADDVLVLVGDGTSWRQAAPVSTN